MATVSVEVQDTDQIHPTTQPETTQGSHVTIFRSKLPDIDIDNTQPLHTYCFEKLHLVSDKPCIIDGSSGKIYTYGEIHLLCRKSAAGLAALGVGHGDVVMVLLQNCPEFVITLMACSMLGAVTTSANPFYTSHEIHKQFKASDAKLVVTQSSYVEKLQSAEFPVIGDGMTVVVVSDGGDDYDKVPESCHGFSDLFNANEDDVPTVVIEPNDPVALPFSSGTTGLPKGVILTHKSIITSVAQQVDGDNPNLYITPEDVFLCVLPLFHIFSLSSVLLCSLRAGCVVLMMKKFEMVSLLELIQKHRISIAAVVPPLVLALAKNPTVENYDLTSIRIVLSGGAPLGNELEDALRRRLPRAVLGQGYGMTEAGPVISMCPAFAKEASPCKSGSCGSIVRNAEMKIVDPDTGVSLRYNQPGEVCIRGEEIMKGYLNDPESTSKTIDVDGWIHTGDIGYVDDDEEIFIVDRVKELIKFKGFQVPPAEIEALLLTNPGIADVAVVP